MTEVVAFHAANLYISFPAGQSLAGRIDPGTGMKEFLSYLKHEKRYSERTVVSYRSDLEQFFRFLEESDGSVAPASVTTRQVRAWVVHLVRDKRMAPASVRRKVSSLNTYFNYLRRRGEVSVNPATGVATVKLPGRIPQYVPAEAMDKISRHLGADDSPQGLADFLMVELLYTTGMRRQELIDLTWPCLDESRKTLRITGKGNKVRQVPLSSELVELLARYRAGLERETGSLPEHIFVTSRGTKLYPKYVYNKVKKYLTEYSSLKKRSPHVLRHTFATHLLNNGADLNDIKELLGHASLASTQVYTHNSIEALKSIYKQAHPKG